MNYYNEIDASNAAWLAELMRCNLIPHGDIDTRDIRDVVPNDLRFYTQCHFFAGIGGWPLALALAGVGADEPLWTGSCPCQPFSAAGRRGGFADERHLWPFWHHLIAQCKPPVVLGEQVASAADWLRLVRGDLEALDYAVGAIPIEAASAGADHLRDRFWFVANAASERRDWREASTGTAGRHVVEGNGVALGDTNSTPANAHPKAGPPRRATGEPGGRSSDMGDANGARPQGWPAMPERTDQWAVGSSGVDVAEPGGNGAGRRPGSGARQEEAAERKHWRASRSSFAPRFDGEIEWVIGADGKARRVKSGICLLVDGFPSRVGLLRGFGNAIDPRPAAAFIRAAFGSIRGTS